jgi:hypothetical protein
LRQDINRQGDEKTGQHFPQHFARPSFMFRVAIGMQETHGNRFYRCSTNGVGGQDDILFVQRSNDATVGTDPLFDFKA